MGNTLDRLSGLSEQQFEMNKSRSLGAWYEIKREFKKDTYTLPAQADKPDSGVLSPSPSDLQLSDSPILQTDHWISQPPLEGHAIFTIKREKWEYLCTIYPVVEIGPHSSRTYCKTLVMLFYMKNLEIPKCKDIRAFFEQPFIPYGHNTQ